MAVIGIGAGGGGGIILIIIVIIIIIIAVKIWSKYSSINAAKPPSFFVPFLCYLIVHREKFNTIKAVIQFLTPILVSCWSLLISAGIFI